VRNGFENTLCEIKAQGGEHARRARLLLPLDPLHGPAPREIIFLELMTSDRKFKASREGPK
jgi:hypothetical protein